MHRSFPNNPNTIMKTTTNSQHEESTYALLIRSEAEESSMPETAVYLLLILTMAFSVWLSAQQRFVVPRIGVVQSAPIVQAVNDSNSLA